MNDGIMNRRGFITSLITGAVLDPERLLWTPGRKLISIPSGKEIISGVWIGPFHPGEDLLRYTRFYTEQDFLPPVRL